ncbi:nuclear transport factor 2 family protein [Pseudonocardia sp. TRM90224]|uniref:nuclear transport factor 2 family protein n=1 Tax=Pseudonocardia sp. TRM90224 TaxID=2812678 RepID=UPI001E64EEF5|nr:nuclear transport factor 2 family protein [Pseudonocardia sp. TRM90224]
MTVPTPTAVHAYIEAWNATGAARRAAIETATTADVRYVDPLADVTGTDALDQLIGGVQQQFPGMQLALVGEIDAHHDVCRFQWGLGPAGQEPIVIGFDVAAIAADGRISTVHGFLDKVPG